MVIWYIYNGLYSYVSCCITVVVDMTNKTTLDMANVWKQTVLNKLTRTAPADGNNNSGKTMQDEPVDPITFPVLLLGNKFDIVSTSMFSWCYVVLLV